ncbi:MAG: TAT-variant-translocated molybdopterin oxidoreductase [Verrucomicrobiales bacterium]
MKNVVHHPERPTTGPRYWRGIADLENTPEFREWLEREFPQGAAELEMDGVSRRSFLRLMGASLALAGFGGLGACRRPEGYLIPHTDAPEWLIPGKSLLYATAMQKPGGAIPLVITTYDGRPTKIEGNPLHPLSAGTTDIFTQASILDLYDPDRSRVTVKEGEPQPPEARDTLVEELRERLASDKGGSAAILLTAATSPTRDRLLNELVEQYPALRVYQHDALTDAEEAAALTAAFGGRASLRRDWERADVIFALDCDFLGVEPGSVADMDASHKFGRRREVHSPEEVEQMNRLYVAETRFTVTGGMADHRLRCLPSEILAVAVAVGRAIQAQAPHPSLAAALTSLDGYEKSDLDPQWVNALADDLLAHNGAALVVAGPRHHASLHSLVLAMNLALNAWGNTLSAARVPDNGVRIEEFPVLVERLRAEAIQTLLVLDGDPVFTSPKDFAWEDLQKSVELSVRLGGYYDATSQAATWHLPQSHYLESWGDVRSSDGTYSIVQPMILPLFSGWSEIELLAKLAGVEFEDSQELVRATFDTLPGADQRSWTLCLRDGFLQGSTYPAAAIPRVASFAKPDYNGPRAGYEVVFAADATLYDGRYANNGWLQELPDPVTKISWDNAAIISMATAKELGVKDADLVEVQLDGRQAAFPVHVEPGHADGVVTLPVGYGRVDESRAVLHRAGFDAYALRTSGKLYFAQGAELKPVGGSHTLAQTQLHHSMEGRDHVREGTVEHYMREPNFAKSMSIDGHLPPNVSLAPPPPLDAPHQWGMTIDLNTCTGCGVCTVACQAENNIPIVGKEQVNHGREMHWIRIDRYFASHEPDEPNPEMVMQPVPCLHCENAPCETVCPVYATVHNEEGLNVMAYNRCIGTRYCANNCPYKVRRFNYFDYAKRQVKRVEVLPGLEVGNLYLGPLGAENDDKMVEMQKNPNVTVRMRGVIEKCSFCVQRLEEAKIDHKVRNAGTDNIVISTDSVKTACQQACPTQAITFGNLSDPNSAVVARREEARKYDLLVYLNVKPRVSYLARLKNPNMAMPDADKIGTHNASGHHHDEEHQTHDDASTGAQLPAGMA